MFVFAFWILKVSPIVTWSGMQHPPELPLFALLSEFVYHTLLYAVFLKVKAAWTKRSLDLTKVVYYLMLLLLRSNFFMNRVAFNWPQCSYGGPFRFLINTHRFLLLLFGLCRQRCIQFFLKLLFLFIFLHFLRRFLLLFLRSFLHSLFIVVLSLTVHMTGVFRPSVLLLLRHSSP